MMRVYRFYLITLGLIILTFTMMTMSVNAMESRRLQHRDAYYEEMENTYEEELRTRLSQEGYRNAGITMTKVFYEDGMREYTVKLHHKRIEALTVEEQEALLAELSKIELLNDECKVYLKFL